MATPLSDNEIQVQLEAFGEKVNKVTDKNRDILIKKINHYKARTAITEVNGKHRRSLSSGRAKNGNETGHSKDDTDEDVQRVDLRKRTRQRAAKRSYASPNKTQLSAEDSFADENRVSLGIQTSLNSTTAFSPGNNQSYLNAGEESLFDDGLSASIKKNTTFDSSDSESERILPNGNVRRYPSLRQFAYSSHRNGNGNSSGLGLRQSTLQRTVGFKTKVSDFIKNVGSFVYSGVESNKRKSKPGGRIYGVEHQISGQHVSSLLLTIFALFFIVVAVIYFEMSSHNNKQPAAAIDDWMICHSTATSSEMEKCNTVAEAEVLRQLIGQIIPILSKHTDESSCFAENCMSLIDLTQRISVQSFVASDDIGRSKLMSRALQLIQKNPQWNLAMLTVDGVVTQLSTEVVCVEKLVTWRRWWCWAVIIATASIRYVALLALVAAVACLVTLYSKAAQRRKEAEIQEMYSFVEKIIDVLEKNHAAQSIQTPASPSVTVLHPSYLAIDHVRDQLIPLKERRGKQKVWNMAVDFLAANESRIRIESQRIVGEMFDVFRWLSPPTVNPGRIWQGQAFSAQRMPKASFLEFCTPCLKIRNMFDLDEECGENWHVRVEDAVLEKCGPDSGIVHVAVDRKAKEGCVYVKCLTREHAANNYSSLHGWWYDGNLVTVKFLRLERYLERFPNAQSATTQLTPSNDQKLSLAKPYHRSCIEVT